ncbi:hypothetical protein O9G_000549 [Rozella allomycis CSF55]|uniref:ARM repeat-containing protein n=1 Tax=Rozella allomycis (strain CSF55) TaxID=988480 RepID=A0A075AW30_ROZAC|nr:hypothetical protein O9G_000549 [Rozella allomycis CSF55]|eukprot:EPZ34362.1 hypothetical protein O9G_000549 [Rozella allomycis CSF55]
MSHHWIHENLPFEVPVRDSVYPLLQQAINIKDYKKASSLNKQCLRDMELKNRVADRKELIVLLWNQLDQTTYVPFIESSMQLLCKLLKDKKNELGGIKLRGMVIKNVLEEWYFVAKRKKMYASRKRVANYVSDVVGLASVFYEESGEEIMECVGGQMNVSRWSMMTRGQILWTYLVPVKKVGGEELKMVREWWELVQNSIQWDMMWTWGVSRVAKGNELIEWDKGWWEWMLIVCMRMLQLQSEIENEGKKIEYPPGFNALRRHNWWIYAMREDGMGIEYLERLIKMSEDYFHPTNNGKWTMYLVSFVSHLAKYFVKRMKVDEWMNKIKDKFVDMLRGPLMMALYGKDLGNGMTSSSGLKMLSFIDADSVLPELMENLIPSMEGLNESHRTSASIVCLGSVIRQITKWDQGREYLKSVMELLLPGIDANDHLKTINTLNFFTQLFMNVVIKKENDFFYEDWSVQFLDRILILIEYLPESNKKYSIEYTMIKMIWNTIDVFFQQLDEEIKDNLINKLSEYSLSRINMNCLKAFSYLCGSSKGSNGSKAIRTFVPLCLREIERELNTENENRLLWFLSILKQVVYHSGDLIIEYLNEIIPLIQKVLKMDNKKVIKCASKLIGNILNSLSSVYPLEYKSYTDNTKSDDSFKIEVEEALVSPSNLCINWYKPTENAKKIVLELIETFFIPNMNEFTLNNLIILKSVFKGMNCLLVEKDKKNLFIDCGYCFNEKDVEYSRCKEIIDQFGDYLNKFYETIRSDNVELFKLLIKTSRMILYNRGIDYVDYEIWKKGFLLQKMIGSATSGDYSRCLRIKKVCLFQLMCYKKNSFNLELKNFHKQLLFNLLKASCNEYSEIRKEAQKVLQSACICINNYQRDIIETIINTMTIKDRVNSLHNNRDAILVDSTVFEAGATVFEAGVSSVLDRKDSTGVETGDSMVVETSDSMVLQANDSNVNTLPLQTTTSALKGCLYLIGNRVFLNYCIKHFDLGCKLLKALISINVNDSSIFELINKVFMEFSLSFYHPIESNSKYLSETIKSITYINDNWKRMSLISNCVDFLFKYNIVDSLSFNLNLCLNDNLMLRKQSINAIRYILYSSKIKNAEIDQKEVSSQKEISRLYQNEICELLKTKIDDDYLKKFISFQIIEQSNSIEIFENSLTNFYFSIGSVIGPCFVDQLIPFLQNLLINIESKPHYRSILEILAGLINSMKHYPDFNISKLTPFIIASLDKLNIENIPIWESFIKSIFRNKDSKRLKEILPLLTEFELNKSNDSFLAESAKVYFTCLIVNCTSNTLGIDFLLNKFNLCVLHADYPFKQVKQHLGSLMFEILRSLGNNSEISNSIYRLLEEIKNEKDLYNNSINFNILDNPSNSNTSNTSNNSESLKPFIDKSKTLIYFLYEIYNRSRCWNLDSLLPDLVIFLLNTFDSADNDLTLMSKKVLRLLSQNNFNKQTLQAVFSSIKSFNHPSWKVRANSISFLQLIFFKNFIHFNKNELIDFSIQFLQDKQVEVREEASKLLCQLIKCKKLFFQNEIDPILCLAEFKKTHLDMWHQHVKEFTPDQLDIVSEVLRLLKSIIDHY